MIKLFFLHFLADFILQPREMGKKKSSDFRWLFGHLSIQFLVFLPFVGWRLSAMNALIHGIIDRNIWRGYKIFAGFRVKKLVDEQERYYREINQLKPIDSPEEEKVIEHFRKNWTLHQIQGFQFWEDHWFYVTIGFDQFLHAATLLYLFG